MSGSICRSLRTDWFRVSVRDAEPVAYGQQKPGAPAGPRWVAEVTVKAVRWERACVSRRAATREFGVERRRRQRGRLHPPRVNGWWLKRLRTGTKKICRFRPVSSVNHGFVSRSSPASHLGRARGGRRTREQ